jgi:hypothetical protein
MGAAGLGRWGGELRISSKFGKFTPGAPCSVGGGEVEKPPPGPLPAWPGPGGKEGDWFDEPRSFSKAPAALTTPPLDTFPESAAVRRAPLEIARETCSTFAPGLYVFIKPAIPATSGAAAEVPVTFR